MKLLLMIITLLLHVELSALSPSIDGSIDEQNVTITELECMFDVSNMKTNRSTGYNWVVSYDKSIFNKPKVQYTKVLSSNNIVGAPMDVDFYFQVKPYLCGKLKNKKTTLAFKYTRPWEEKAAKTRVVNITFE